MLTNKGAGISAAQNYTEQVEVQMHKQDSELLAQIQGLVSHADELDQRESTHFNTLSEKQGEQERVEVRSCSCERARTHTHIYLKVVGDLGMPRCARP